MADKPDFAPTQWPWGWIILGVILLIWILYTGSSDPCGNPAYCS